MGSRRKARDSRKLRNADRTIDQEKYRSNRKNKNLSKYKHNTRPNRSPEFSGESNLIITKNEEVDFKPTNKQLWLEYIHYIGKDAARLLHPEQFKALHPNDKNDSIVAVVDPKHLQDFKMQQLVEEQQKQQLSLGFAGSFIGI